MMFHYDITTPIDRVFLLAQEFQDYASAYDSGTTVNLITMVYNILRKTGQFKSALITWNKKSSHERI